MKITLVTDWEDNSVLYVLVSKTTTAEEIQDIANKVKEEKSGYWTYEDILEALPDDVEVIDYKEVRV